MALQALDRRSAAAHCAGASPPQFVQFQDGTWVTEIQVDQLTYEQAGPANVLSALSSAKSGLGPTTWRVDTDTP